MHEDELNLSEVQYRLWARMLVTGVDSSKENPPQVPMITGSTPRHPVSQNSSVVQSPQINQTVSEGTAPQKGLGVSPGKISEIRGESYTQLATLKQLYEDGVLTLTEFDEQKEMILGGLKKLQ